MTRTPRIFGAHLSVAGGLHLALLEARRIVADCVQIFVKNQRQWAARPLEPAQMDAFRAAAAETRISPAVAHASYLLNLATPDEAIRERSKAALIDELMRCHALGIDALVFHPGAAMGDSESAAIARVADALNHVFEAAGDGPTRVLVECTAGQGTTIGHRFDHLGGILAACRHPQRLGVCLDTCHLFASGHDFRTAEGYAAMMQSLHSEVGLDRVHCIHTNDSKGGLGSRVDRHAHIGEGQIGLAGFAHMLTDDRLARVPFILETEHGEDENGRDLNEVNLERLRSLVADPRK
jgi:deoxyribonuclease-4